MDGWAAEEGVTHIAHGALDFPSCVRLDCGHDKENHDLREKGAKYEHNAYH